MGCWDSVFVFWADEKFSRFILLGSVISTNGFAFVSFLAGKLQKSTWMTIFYRRTFWRSIYELKSLKFEEIQLILQFRVDHLANFFATLQTRGFKQFSHIRLTFQMKFHTKMRKILRMTLKIQFNCTEKGRDDELLHKKPIENWRFIRNAYVIN